MHSKVDIIVIGATGFTGTVVVKNLALLSKESEYSDISWGISGRSKNKMQNLLTELQESGTDTSKIPMIECDIQNADSCVNVARHARVLMNAAGPYCLLGDPVVAACIKTGTHYLDISAELYHMLNTYITFNKAAELAQVMIVLACGFATVPVTTGLMYLEKHFEGQLRTVECYTELVLPRSAYIPGTNKCLVNEGTWRSMIHEMETFRKYTELKKQIFPKLEPVAEDKRKSFFHRHIGRCWYPYPGPDQDIVEMTQTFMQNKKAKRPYFFKIYSTMPLFIHFILVVPLFFLCYILCYFKCFSKLLKNNPKTFSLGYFSKKGPTEEMKRDTKYSFTFIGKGSDNGRDTNSSRMKTMSVKVSGSDPGYETTAVAFICSAVTILRERSQMPKGGVLTTGSAFWDTEIIDRLHRNGINFEVIEQQSNKK